MSIGSTIGGAVAGGASMLPFGGMIDSFMHPEKGYQAAGEQFQKYYKDAQGNLQPYNQNGQNQIGRLNNQAEALNNPGQLQNQWSQGYETSPQAKQLMDQAQSNGLDAASSMGLMGSSGALNNIQKQSTNIMQGDRQNYMNDLMQKYMASIGIGTNMYGTGANAAGAMSTNAMKQGENMGAAAYGEQNAPGDTFGKGLAFLGNLAGNVAKAA